MSNPTTTDDPEPRRSTAFRPGWWRLCFAFVLALGAFFLPQEVPLEWYPLNEPGNDILYLEIKCAADKEGAVQIYYDLAGAHNPDLYNIYFPIGPSEMTFTYTFPLPDAPIIGLRLDPVGQGGTLRIDNFRIIDRRAAVVRHFSREDLTPLHQIASVESTATGWKITSTPDANDPFLKIELASPFVAKDINHRNLLRCLLSTGYLTMMLTIILFAVIFTFHWPPTWKDFFQHLAFWVALAALFAAVGNRGLIRNSVRFAQFAPPQWHKPWTLEVDALAPKPATAQLFPNSGQGIGEETSQRIRYEATPGVQTLRFRLPDEPLRELRFDPLDLPGKVSLRALRLLDGYGNVRALLPLASLLRGQDLAEFDVRDDGLHLSTTPDGSDSIVTFSDAALAQINQARAGATSTAPTAVPAVP